MRSPSAKCRTQPLIAAALAAATLAQAANDANEPTKLDAFVVRESALANLGDIAPTSRPIPGVYGDGKNILEIPRSVTMLTPELLRQFNINSFADLDKIGAGTQQRNYYGVPGMPSIRGARGSVYFNGMQRAFNRNEMPLSFGSLDAIDIVKGPAPAHFGPGLVGGYVNLIPKIPYFDKFRGQVKATAGSDSSYTVQTDIGGPVEVAGRPAAYRVSLTGQMADSYYDRIGNDYVSMYASLKAEIAKDITIFSGGEFFDFRSNENAGWNRPTQALIDRGEYIIGEPVSISSPAWGGNAVRTLVEFPFTFHLSPPFGSPLLALAIPGDIARARIPANLRSLMIDMNVQANVNAVYQALPQNQVPGFAMPSLQPVTVGALNQVARTTQDVYVYTPAYFNAGGEVLTEKIDASTVLSDSRDYANSKNLFYFFDIENTRPVDASVKNQFIMEFVDTDKLSTYGYAIKTKQFIFENKLSVTQKFDVAQGMTVHYGVSARYNDAKMLQDFYAEPFSRRDITRPEINPNTVILTGGQRGPDGRNFWSPTAQGGANAHSQLWQLSAFAVADNKWTDWLTTYTSVLGAYAPYTTQYPDEVDLVPANSPRREKVQDSRTYYSVAFSPTVTPIRGLSLYATAQTGTALDPLQGGAIVGKGNFSKNELLEAGIKTSLIENTLYASVALHKWRQTAFDDRTNNAEPLKGKGVEFETTWIPLNGLALIGSVNAQRVQRESGLGFRPAAYTDREWALYGGVLAYRTGTAFPANNPEMVYPGSPEVQAKLFARYQHGSGFGIAGGPVWSASYWHNFDRTLRIPSSLVWNANLFYDLENWSFMLSVENVTGEERFLGAEPVFGANTLITKAPEEPRWSIIASHRF